MGVVLEVKEWKDGPLSCSCNDNDPPACGDKCVKVLAWSATALAFISVCTHSLVPAIP